MVEAREVQVYVYASCGCPNGLQLRVLIERFGVVVYVEARGFPIDFDESWCSGLLSGINQKSRSFQINLSKF